VNKTGVAAAEGTHMVVVVVVVVALAVIESVPDAVPTAKTSLVAVPSAIAASSDAAVPAADCTD
jgi:hypothetical protein